MRNCLKYVQQCQNESFKKKCQATTLPYSVIWISAKMKVLRKSVRQQRYPIQLCGSPLDIMYTLEVWGIP